MFRKSLCLCSSSMIYHAFSKEMLLHSIPSTLKEHGAVQNKGIDYTPSSSHNNDLGNAGDLHCNKDEELPLMKAEMGKSSLSSVERSAKTNNMTFSRSVTRRHGKV